MQNKINEMLGSDLKKIDTLQCKINILTKKINKEIQGFDTFNPSLDYLRYYWEVAPTQETHESKHCGWAKKNALYMSKNKEDYFKHQMPQDAITTPKIHSISENFSMISGIIDGRFQYIILKNDNSRQFYKRKLKKEQKEKLQKIKQKKINN